VFNANMLKRVIKKWKYWPLIDFFRKPNRLMMRNIFKSKFTKKVLICYIIEPFLYRQEKKSHSNQIEAKVIARIFNKLGFRVDVVDYRYRLNIEFSKYDLIFGFGDIYEKSFHSKSFNGLRIGYATGGHPLFRISEEIKKLNEFRIKTGVNALPARISGPVNPLAFSYSDALILIGNAHTAKTFDTLYSKKIHIINVTNYFDLSIDFSKKKTRGIVWIGSSGSIHKGLDLVLEASLELSKRHKVIIIGRIDDDVRGYFLEHYNNVDFHGFLNVTSEKFTRIIEKCSYVIFPSCSEGQSSALVLAMGYGCIPIATRQTGVDVERYGKLVSNNSAKDIIDVVNELDVEFVDDETLIRRSIEISESVRDEHSINKFESNFETLLREILGINN